MTRPASARAALALTPLPQTPAPAAPLRAARASRAATTQPDARLGTSPHQPPDLMPIQSSNLAAVGHDGQALWVRFRNGTLYRYPTAGRDLHDGLAGAQSPGSYFLDRIRHFHRGERIE